MITNKNADAILSLCPLQMTDGSTIECFVIVISNSDADIHRIDNLRRLFDVDQTLLERTPRDKIEGI